jgi:hypothetical protein
LIKNFEFRNVKTLLRKQKNSGMILNVRNTLNPDRLYKLFT